MATAIDGTGATDRMYHAGRPGAALRHRPNSPMIASTKYHRKDPSTMKPILVLNGPNLNLLGQREPDLYGHETLADVEAVCAATAKAEGLTVTCHQSNREYELIDWIHDARSSAAAIVINPGAFGHTSVAILDALNAFVGPVIEVHVSNIHRREAFRHHSYVAIRADAVIAGAGVQGYGFAVARAARLLNG